MLFLCSLPVLVLQALPLAPELDFGVLPAANTAPAYKFSITIGVDGKPPVVLPFEIGRVATPEDVADTLQRSLEDYPWAMKRNGLRVTLQGFDKVRVTKIQVDGAGPKPEIRWVLAPAQKK